MGGSAVSGATSSTYSFSESAGSYLVTCTVTDSASTPITSSASNAVTITVNQLTITVTQGANGVIAPITTNVNYGGSQTFTITPNAGYSIASLTVDGSVVAVASSYTFSNVLAPHTITATFALIPASTPTPAPTSSASASTPTPTSTPAATSISTTTPTTPLPTPVSTQTPTVQNENQSATLAIELISVIAGAIAVVVISVATFMIKKRNKSR